jgi:integrase
VAAATLAFARGREHHLSDDVEALHTEITERGTSIRANRVVAIPSGIFRYAVHRKMRADNPCTGIQRNRDAMREAYHTPDQIARLGQMLDAWPDKAQASAGALLLLTGCLRGELLKILQAEFDLKRGIWRLAQPDP